MKPKKPFEKWTSTCGRVTLYRGDCLDVMPTLDADSVDSVICDPPYGLSNRGGDSLGKVYSDVVFPSLADFYSERLCNGEFVFPLDSVSLLDFVNRAIGVKANVAVPESSINLKGDLAVGKEEVKTTSNSAVLGADHVLSNEVDPNPEHIFTNFVLQPRPNWNASLADCFSSCYREFGLGKFRVTVVVAPDSDFARFLSTLQPASPSFLSDVVRLQNDATTQPLGSPGVVASTRTELTIVLSFDTCRGTIEILPASSTSESGFLCEIISTEQVGARTRASGLPAKFQSTQFGLVGDSANRACHFFFHSSFIAYSKKERKGFMGKLWDHGVPGVPFWEATKRVMKPGAMLLAFGGSRTFHRLTCAIEDAGLEIRDCLMWLYGSGFPKSLDISKGIDRAAGAEREVVGYKPGQEGFANRKKPILSNSKSGTAFDRPWKHDEEKARLFHMQTAPATPDAQTWDGYGTALKPAFEPITMAMKPLDGTFAANALKHGVAGLNIDGGRIATEGEDNPSIARRKGKAASSKKCWSKQSPESFSAVRDGETLGRWPANIILDEAAAAELDEQSGVLHGAGPYKKPETNDGNGPFFSGPTQQKDKTRFNHLSGSGGASRFFYCAKPSKAERNAGLDSQNHHPTVKPIALLRYLARLTKTPTGGNVLDPFMGSGSTGCAAVLEGRAFIGIEKESEYFEIAKRRIVHALAEVDSDMLAGMEIG